MVIHHGVVTAPTAFAEVSQALFGDGVDPQELWQQSVAKMHPDASGAHAPGILRIVPLRRGRVRKFAGDQPPVKRPNKTLDRLGEGLGVASLGIGSKDIYHGTKKLHAAKLLGESRVKPALKIAEGTALLGGDVLGTMALKNSADKKVTKGFSELVDGTVHRLRLLSGTAKPVVTTAGREASWGAKQQNTVHAGKQVRTDVNNFAGTTTGKVVIGSGAAAAGYKGLQRHQRKQADQAYYGKRDVDDVTFAGTFSKLDDDKHLAFGWASVTEVNGLPVVDRQGDYIGIDDIEEAAYTYVQKSRVGGDMHRRSTGKDLAGEDRPHQVAELVESMVFTPEKIAKMELPRSFPVGWWCGFKVHDEDAWQEIKKGNRTGFSIHGKGIRKDVDYDSVMLGSA